jgi:tungstate transport system substrate-binding protein
MATRLLRAACAPAPGRAGGRDGPADGGAAAQERFIVLASTTSTEQSGLFGHLLPLFRQATGIEVRVVALGTGKALDAARRGDADAVLVHDRAAEERFVAEGFARERRDVMFNDFVLDRPGGRPRARGAAATSARRWPGWPPRRLRFISRGDRSGTHAAELRLWKRVEHRPGRQQARRLPRVRLRHGPGAQHGGRR